MIEALRAGDAFGGATPTFMAWLALRTAIIRSDSDLLAVASVWSCRAEAGWESSSIAAQVARARSDWADERDALAAFVAAIENDAVTVRMLLHAARIAQGASLRNLDIRPLVDSL